MNKFVILVAICSMVLSGTIVANATDKAYYWDRSSGVNIDGFTTNWTSCGTSQTGYRITNLSNVASSCTNGLLSRSGSAGDLFLAIFPTTYSFDTQIRGMSNANFTLRGNNMPATYRFDLGYVQAGIFTTLGSVVQTNVPIASYVTYIMDMSIISGTAPAGSNLAFKVSVTTSGGGRIGLGTDGGGINNSNSGRFYVNETAIVPPSTPTYNVTIRALPVTGNIYAGNSYVYGITVNNTGNTKGNYTLSLSDSDTTNFITSTFGTTAMEINSGSSAETTLTVGANTGATIGAVDTTTINIISVENPIYANSTQVSTTVVIPPPEPSRQVLVKANRYVVLDDPIDGTASTGSGFFNPSGARGSWTGTNYWYGESTTIRAATLITDNNGTPKSGINVNFNLMYPNNTVLSIASLSSVTDSRGIAYYSFNLNDQKYWGYWRIDASANIDGANIQNSTSFVLNWWGCAQCHDAKSNGPNTWGRYANKSYYTIGYDFHRSSSIDKHVEPMTKGNCIICHQSYNGTPVNWRFTSTSPTINVDSEYTPDWHDDKKKCQDCHEGSNLPKGSAGQDKNPEIAGCYDTVGCHVQKNVNLTRVNSTTGYVVGNSYRINYSDIQNSNVAKAHNDARVECIVCHGAGHNITKPYNISSTSNAYTENDQCWICHTERLTTHQSNSNCVGCHSQDAHRITGGDGSCIACHQNDVNISKFGRHANLSTSDGIGIVSDSDCWTCHYNKDMNKNNVYLCESCHTNNTGVVPVNDPVLIVGNLAHGPQQCKSCHAPVKYHMDGTVGPKGFMDLFGLN